MKNRVKIFRIISAAISAFFLLTIKAQAANIGENLLGGLAGGLAGKLISLLAYAIISTIGFFITIIAGATNWILKINFEVISSPTVQTGWTISRDIANLGFVLILILIALATVLRYKSYGAQQLLIKLIGAAIIVNFSLTIAGFILDFTNVLAKFFINQAFGDLGDIAGGLGQAFQPQKFLDIFSNWNFTSAGGVAFLIQSVVGLISGSIFSLLILIILICFMILFLIRYVWLAILLIVSPIAWLMYAIPQEKGLFSTWWKKFLQWCFFAPACLFFLYLAMLGANQGSISERREREVAAGVGGSTQIESRANLTAQVSNTANSASEASAEPPELDFDLGDIMGTVLNLIVFGGLMVGGIIAAGSFSLMGSKAVVGAGTAASKNVGKWGGRMALKYPGLGMGTGLAALSDKLNKKGPGGRIQKTFTGAVNLGRKVATPIGKAVGKPADAILGKAELTGKNSLYGSTWSAIKKGSGLFGEYEKGKKKEEIAKKRKERDGLKNNGQSLIKEGQNALEQIEKNKQEIERMRRETEQLEREGSELRRRSLDIKVRAAEALARGEKKLAEEMKIEAEKTLSESQETLKKSQEISSNRQKMAEELAKNEETIRSEAAEKIKQGQEMMAEAEKIDDQIKDIAADLAQTAQKEAVDKEAHKKAEEHAKESGGGHEESHAKPAESSGGGSSHSH